MSIVDVDAHYSEAIDDLAEYIDPGDPWHERFTEEGAKLLPSGTPDHYRYGRIQRTVTSYSEREMSPDEIPVAMRHVGIDKSIIISSKLQKFARMGADDRRPELLATAYLDFAVDRLVDPENGIYTVVMIPHQDVDVAVDLLERGAEEDGIVGGCFVTPRIEPPLGNRRYDPIYETAQEHDLPLIFHGAGSSLDHFHTKGFERFIETHSLGFVQNNMIQLTSVIIKGVPEKFPDLDIVFLESGILWIPGYMYRLDAEYKKRQAEAPLLERKPSRYINEFYIGTQPIEDLTADNEQYFESAIDIIGPEQLLYASDYPHWDYDPPSSIESIPFLSAAEKRQILGENAEAVFGI